MATATKLVWTPNAQASDGSSLTAAELAALTFTVQIDTVSPPVKSYQIPTSAINSVPAASGSGTQLTALFSALNPPFVPVDGVQYFAQIEETDDQGTSAPSAIVTFTNTAVPGAPLAFGVA
jgi:hypothetical protein